MNWLEPPFNLIVSGITNCGKTHFVLDLLETVFRKKFDYIVIFCPTFQVNKTYERPFIKNNPNVIVLHPKAVSDDLESMLTICVEAYSGKNTLFLIDDCANQKSIKKKASELTNLAFSGRHHGISVWFITQKYNAVVKDFRDNIRHLVLFYEKDEDSLKTALTENAIIPKDKRQSTIEELKRGRKSKLLLRIEAPYDYCIEHN